MMGLTYNFGVPPEWSLGAKDYFIMGDDGTANPRDQGISTFLTQFSNTSNFNIPDYAQKAWAFVAAHILNTLELTTAGWEDLNVQTTGIDQGCQLRFEVNDGLGLQQSLIDLNLYRDKKPISSDDVSLKYRSCYIEDEGSEINRLIRDLDPTVGMAVKTLANYYPRQSYSAVKDPKTDIQVYTDDEGQRVRKRVYCVERFFGDPRPRITVWWIEVKAFALSEAFQEHYIPLSLEEDEAQVFFGHIPLRPLAEILKNTWRAMKDSVRLYKARRVIL